MPATFSVSPAAPVSLAAPSTSRGMGANTHRSVAKAMRGAVLAFTERNSTASSIDTRRTGEASASSAISRAGSAASISSLSR